MYCAAFMVEPGICDERFHALDALIEEAALATPGYLGSESSRSPNGTRDNATCFWDKLDALRAFSAHPKPLEGKRQCTERYQGFHIVISQVLRSYGDGTIAHIAPNERDHSQRAPA